MKIRHITTPLWIAVLLLGARSNAQDRDTFWSIVHILRRDHLSGSLQYYGRCGNENEYVTRGFPIITIPTNSGPSLPILREMFSKDPEIQITQQPNGTVQIKDQFVPQDLLNVKIRHLSFDDWQKEKGPLLSAFPSWVLNFILDAPEVRTFMKDQGIGRAHKKRSFHESSGGEPHVSGELNNVTLSQALDYMAPTFHGLWVYKECREDKGSNRLVDFSFYQSWQ